VKEQDTIKYMCQCCQESRKIENILEYAEPARDFISSNDSSQSPPPKSELFNPKHSKQYVYFVKFMSTHDYHNIWVDYDTVDEISHRKLLNFIKKCKKQALEQKTATEENKSEEGGQNGAGEQLMANAGSNSQRSQVDPLNGNVRYLREDQNLDCNVLENLNTRFQVCQKLVFLDFQLWDITNIACRWAKRIYTYLPVIKKLIYRKYRTYRSF